MDPLVAVLEDTSAVNTIKAEAVWLKTVAGVVSDCLQLCGPRILRSLSLGNLLGTVHFSHPKWFPLGPDEVRRVLPHHFRRGCPLLLFPGLPTPLLSLLWWWVGA